MARAQKCRASVDERERERMKQKKPNTRSSVSHQLAGPAIHLEPPVTGKKKRKEEERRKRKETAAAAAADGHVYGPPISLVPYY